MHTIPFYNVIVEQLLPASVPLMTTLPVSFAAPAMGQPTLSSAKNWHQLPLEPNFQYLQGSEVLCAHASAQSSLPLTARGAPCPGTP